ncbi:putative lipase/esterase family protein [Xylariales sp. PMI_506]|nr:putative lipase/esterase family protein [Xylariales sp. PMI_506]
MILSLTRGLQRWFQPTIDALTIRRLPWKYRWRLLVLQTVSLIVNSISFFRYKSCPYVEEWLPVSPGRKIRVLVFDDPTYRGAKQEDRLRPLHLDIHGGAFIGGMPEHKIGFCDRLAKATGAVVISPSYRLAPRYPFPGAIDDIDAVTKYLQEHAEERWGADPRLMTTSGDSAGGCLALALCQQSSCHITSPTSIKGSVTYYAAIDLRLRPEEKPKSAELLASGMKRDPLQVLLPLYDAYASPVRSQNMDNPRLSPVIASPDHLPENMLLVIAGLDIVVHEQLTFVERIKEEMSRNPDYADRKVETLYMEKAFHGFLDVPSPIVPVEMKDRAINSAVEFLRQIHRKYGWFGQ